MESLEKLLIDEEAYFESLVEKAKKIFKIGRETGELIYTINPLKLTLSERIVTILLARFLAYKLSSKILNPVNSEDLSPEEISAKLGVNRKQVSARLTELKRKGYVESTSRGRYKISPINVAVILDNIDNILEKVKEVSNPVSSLENVEDE